jgi:predicted O-methyltransferase YrrM
MKEKIEFIKQEALKQQVPIMCDESIEYIISNLLKYRCKSILEVGTAVGFSAISIANAINDVKITTIERDDDRFAKAKRNIEEMNLTQRIYPVYMDALDYLCTQTYDALIIDAAKAQNKTFFDRFFPFVKPRGIVIVDNLDFHGHNENVDLLTDRRNLRQMVNKIRAFEDYIKSRDDLDVERVFIGDGMMLIQRTSHSFNFNE